MRFLCVTSALLLATQASCSSLLSAFSSQTTLDEPVFPVPGENPLGFCQDPVNYILDVDYVDLVPNPPIPGEALSIKGNGTFSETIEQGAKVQLTVKLNKYITLIKTEQDLCDNLVKIDVECPLNGSLAVEKEVNIPKQVPKGTYDVSATVTDKNGKLITCMSGSVHF